MKSKRTITLAASDVNSMINDLSLIVVSMDHMGSTYYDSPRKLAQESEKFLQKIKAFKILARMRGVLEEAYESQSPKAEVLQMEEEAEKLPYWHWKPPKDKKK